MIRIGIIGCGKIAQVRHIPEYADNPDAELYAFFSPNRTRAEEQAAKYGGKVCACGTDHQGIERRKTCLM